MYILHRLTLLCLLCCSTCLPAQVQSRFSYFRQFQNCFTECTVLCQDGGLLISGYTNNTGYGNGFLLRTDSSGLLRWSQEVSMTQYGEYQTAIAELEGGDIGFTARTVQFDNTNGWHEKPVVMRLDSAGNPKWARYFNGTPSDYVSGIVAAPDKGMLVIGGRYDPTFSPGHVSWLARLDSAGQTQWLRQLGEISSSSVSPYLIRNHKPGRYLVAGMYSFSAFPVSEQDMYLSEWDDAGNMLWIRYYGETGYALAETPLDLITAGDSLYLAGRCSGYDYYYSFLLSLDTLGNPGHCRIFTGEHKSLTRLTDGRMVICSERPVNFPPDASLDAIWLDATGLPLFARTYGGSGVEHAAGVQPAPHGGVWLTGRTTTFTASGGNAYPFLVLADAQGASGCYDSVLTPVWKDTVMGSPVHNMIAGTGSYPTVPAIPAIQAANFTDQPICLTTSRPAPPSSASPLPYPNPTTGHLRIPAPVYGLRLLNTQGKTCPFSAFETEGVWELDLRELPAGVYLLEGAVSGETVAFRILLLPH